MATKTTKKKGETSTTVAVGIRIDPKVKFALDIMGRLQKRSLTAVIEWAVTKAIAEYQIDENDSLGDKINEIWSTDEVVRTTRLVTKLPQAATYDEMRIWDTIRNSPDLWDEDVLDEATLHRNWRALLSHVDESKHWSTAEPFVVPVSRSELYEGDDVGHGDPGIEISDAIDHLTGKS